jgi:Protein of unknown function (DUF3999)
MKLAAAAIVLLAPALAAAEQPRDFAYGILLKTGGGSAFHQLEVPRAVYEGVLRPDLGDVRVFNGAGEVVPHAFRPRATTSRQARPAVSLPLFAIRTDAPAGMGGVTLRLQTSGDRTVIDLRTPDGKPARGTTLVGYVADARALEMPIRAVVVRLPAATEQLVAKITVEASDDLLRWDTLASGAPLVSLASGGARLEQLRVEVPARKTKYLRVSWPGRGAAVELAGLDAEPGEAIVDAPRQWKHVTVASVKDRSGEHEVDLGGHFPVDRLRIALPHPNTVASLEILARARPADPWRPVTAATAYRLTREGEELTSADIEIGQTPDRYWLVKVDQRGGGIGTGPLVVGAGWVPHRLLFAARGAEPFQLAYGRHDARPAAFSIATLVPGYKGEEDLELRRGATPSGAAIGQAQAAAAAQPLGGERALHPGIDWKRWTLWATLVLGVGLLGWMAVKLGRQMGMTDSPR